MSFLGGLVTPLKTLKKVKNKLIFFVKKMKKAGKELGKSWEVGKNWRKKLENSWKKVGKKLENAGKKLGKSWGKVVKTLEKVGKKLGKS